MKRLAKLFRPYRRDDRISTILDHINYTVIDYKRSSITVEKDKIEKELGHYLENLTSEDYKILINQLLIGRVNIKRSTSTFKLLIFLPILTIIIYISSAIFMGFFIATVASSREEKAFWGLLLALT